MGLLSKLFGGGAGPGIHSLTDDCHWHINGAKDYCSFFRAIPTFCPNNAVLGLAAGFPQEELARFLADNAFEFDDAFLKTFPQDFQRANYLRVDVPTMVELERFAEQSAEPEIAIHLIVISEGLPLLEWYDAPDDPIAISNHVGENTVMAFARAIGGTHGRVEAGV